MSKRIILSSLFLVFIFAVTPLVYLSDIEIAEVTSITEREYEDIFEVNGTVDAVNEIPIYLSYPVYIKECHISENDYVNKGQLLFTLDIEKMEQAVKSDYLTDYAEVYSVNKSDLIGISDKIYASESGYVRNIANENGSIVLSEENLCTITSSDNLQLKITLNQEDYWRIAVGDRINFSLIILPNTEFEGIINDKTAVIRKETTLTGSKTVIDVFANINSEDKRITDGLQFSGRIIKSNEKPIYTLPYEYINQDEEGEYINIFSDGEIIKKYVETGIETEEYTEILNIEDKDLLIIKNSCDTKGKIVLKYEYK